MKAWWGKDLRPTPSILTPHLFDIAKEINPFVIKAANILRASGAHRASSPE